MLFSCYLAGPFLNFPAQALKWLESILIQQMHSGKDQKSGLAPISGTAFAALSCIGPVLLSAWVARILFSYVYAGEVPDEL